jgi:hypothetical protein
MRERPQTPESRAMPEAESRPAPEAAGDHPEGVPRPRMPVAAGAPAPGEGDGSGAPGPPGARGVTGVGGSTRMPALAAKAGAHAAASGASAPGSSAPVGDAFESSASEVARLPAQEPVQKALEAGESDTTEESGGSVPDEETEPEPDAPDEDDSGADHTPPVLEGLRFDPAQVEGGSVTTLTVQASDAKSGLKSVWGEARSPNRSANLSFGSRDVSGGTSLSFPVTIPRAAEAGTWYVAWISLTDAAANTKLIQAASASAAPAGGTFSVISSESDATKPDVLRVWFDKSAVTPGQKNKIGVEARDDGSGIASMMGACQSPSKSALIWFFANVNEESGTLEADVQVPSNADCGQWGVQQLSVKDKAGNTTLLAADSQVVSSAGFQVTAGSDCDFTSPTLDAFDLSPAIVLSGTPTEILVTARVYDVGSGAVSMTGWFEGPPPPGGLAPKANFSCSPNPSDASAPWTGRIQVPPQAAKGTWKVGTIRLEDKAKNFRVYSSADPVVSGRVFVVQ